MKVCAEAGCPTLTATTRCPACTREKDKARGTPAERGYDADYRRQRKAAAPHVEAGRLTCWRCHTRIAPGAPWTLGHCDLDRSVIHGPEHEGCGLATSGRVGCEHASHRCQVTVVCGPPCSGKTTWVREHARPGDLIVDYDDIAVRLGSPQSHHHHPSMHGKIEAVISRAIAGIKDGRHERAWIIRSGVARAHELAAELGGTVVVIDEPDDVLFARADRRPDSAVTKRAIVEWRAANISRRA